MVLLKSTNKRRTARPRVEILGLFASGKTTLATRLANGFCAHLAENHAVNPFWGRDDVLEVTGQLPYDLSFLLQHCRLAAEPCTPGENPLGICDWSFASDRLWALMRNANEIGVYDAVHQRCRSVLGDPVGYLYLRHPIEVVASRLVGRARTAEIPLLSTLKEASHALDTLVADLPRSRVRVCGDDLAREEFADALCGWLAENEA